MPKQRPNSANSSSEDIAGLATGPVVSSTKPELNSSFATVANGTCSTSAAEEIAINHITAAERKKRRSSSNL